MQELSIATEIYRVCRLEIERRGAECLEEVRRPLDGLPEGSPMALADAMVVVAVNMLSQRQLPNAWEIGVAVAPVEASEVK